MGKVIHQLTQRISINKIIEPEQCAVLWLAHVGSPVWIYYAYLISSLRWKMRQLNVNSIFWHWESVPVGWVEVAPSSYGDWKLYLECLALMMASLENMSTRVHNNGTVHCHRYLDFAGSPVMDVLVQKAFVSCYKAGIGTAN